MPLKPALLLLCVFATPLAADPCLPDDMDWPDTDIAFLEQAIEVQQNMAQKFYDAKDPKTAMTCAWQASDSSAHLLKYAALERVKALSFEGNLLRQTGSLEAAHASLKTAAAVIESHFLTQDRAATNAALTTWALPMATLMEHRSPDRAVAAYTQIHIWTQCARIFVPDPAQITDRITQLGGQTNIVITDEICQAPLTLTAFR